MATSVAWFSDRDLQSEFGFVVDGLAGWPGNLASAPRDVPILEGPETVGGLIDPRLVRLRPGEAMITGRFELGSISLALTALDAMKATLGEGEVKVRTAYATDRYCLAVLKSHDGEAYQKEFVNGFVRASLSFTVKDGVALRNSPDGYALSTARTACPIGTWFSQPTYVIHGGGGTLTNPLLTIRSAAGDPMQSMGFTVALGANDFLRIDAARADVSLVSAGSITDGKSLWVSGDFPILRPADGWVEGGLYPTVELSGSAGTAKGEITYARRYR